MWVCCLHFLVYFVKFAWVLDCHKTVKELIFTIDWNGNGKHDMFDTYWDLKLLKKQVMEPSLQEKGKICLMNLQKN